MKKKIAIDQRKTFGLELSKELDAKKITKKQAGKLSGINYQSILGWCNGVQYPSEKLFYKLYDSLKLSPELKQLYLSVAACRLDTANETRSALGVLITKARTDAGISTAQLTELLKVKCRRVAEWETGRCLPRKATWDKLKTVLDLPEEADHIYQGCGMLRYKTVRKAKLSGLGASILSARIAAGLSRSTLANFLGVKQSRKIYRWERGITKPPKDIWNKLKALFGLPEEADCLYQEGTRSRHKSGANHLLSKGRGWILECRLNLGITQEELSKALGLSPSSMVSIWESGKRNPSEQQKYILKRLFEAKEADHDVDIISLGEELRKQQNLPVRRSFCTFLEYRKALNAVSGKFTEEKRIFLNKLIDELIQTNCCPARIAKRVGIKRNTIKLWCLGLHKPTPRLFDRLVKILGFSPELWGLYERFLRQQDGTQNTINKPKLLGRLIAEARMSKGLMQTDVQKALHLSSSSTVRHWEHGYKVPIRIYWYALTGMLGLSEEAQQLYAELVKNRPERVQNRKYRTQKIN